MDNSIWRHNTSWERTLFLRGQHDVMRRLKLLPAEITMILQQKAAEKETPKQ